MDDKAKGGLQHLPTGAALSLHSTRSSIIIARGRRDATANAASNPYYRQAITDYNAGNFAEAASGFQRAAEQGHAESQYLLSTMYDEGQGLPQDSTQAAFWERKAAEQGHAYAQANLSFRYYATNDFAEAFAWCQRAAHSNLAWAQYNLGLMYRKGEGVAQHDTEAAYWYRPGRQPELSRSQCRSSLTSTTLARASPSATRRQPRGIARPPIKATLKPNSNSAISTPLARASSTTTPSLATGLARPALQGHKQAVRELKPAAKYRDP